MSNELVQISTPLAQRAGKQYWRSLDELADTKEFDRVYQEYFGPVLPARSMVQQIKPGDRKEDAEGRYPDLEQVSLIAVKKH